MKEQRRADSGILLLLLDVLDYGFNRASWHGPNLGASLRDVDAGMALRRVAGRRCIWEQALHAAYWKQRVLNKLVGRTPFPGRGSNWPKLPNPPSAAAWKRDLSMLRAIHARLRAALAASDPARLRDPMLVRMIIGAAMHDIYHAGQIRLLRRMLRKAP